MNTEVMQHVYWWSMKTLKYLTALTVTMLPLLTGFAQTSPVVPAAPMAAPASLPPSAAEVEKLTKSGVGDEIVLSYIKQYPNYYNLSAADIVALKSAGVSSQAVTAMLNHDGALANQQQPPTPVATTASPPQIATAPVAATPSSSTVTATAAAPTSTGTVVVPPTPAPAPQVEVIPVTPGPDYVWTPGYWSWTAGGWIWLGGYWRYPPRPSHVWIGGHWTGHGHSHVWVRGYWH